jgi:hypothetical protein
MLIGVTLFLCNRNPNKIDEKVKKMLEEPFIVSDAQDLNNYDAFREYVQKLPDNFDEDNIKNPPADKIVSDYGKGNNEVATPYITDINFGQDKPYPVVSCSNSSINHNMKSGPMKLVPDQISCGFPNKLTAENYYKTFYNARSIPLDNDAVRGANYGDYSDTVNPNDINVRILSQNTKGLIPSATAYRNIPTGSNYAFYNTPAMPMP